MLCLPEREPPPTSVCLPALSSHLFPPPTPHCHLLFQLFLVTNERVLSALSGVAINLLSLHSPSPSSLPMTSSNSFPTGKKKKKKIREGRQCWMKRKSWQGTKDAVNYSDTSRRFLKGVGRSVQGSHHPSPLRVQVSVPPARHGFWLP